MSITPSGRAPVHRESSESMIIKSTNSQDEGPVESMLALDFGSQRQRLHAFLSAVHTGDEKVALNISQEENPMRHEGVYVDSGRLFHFAALIGDRTSLQILLRYQPNLDDETSWGVTALYLAVLYRHVPVAKCLLEAGASPNLLPTSTEIPPLHIAIRDNDFELVQLLLQNGADTKPTCYKEDSTLHIAVRQGAAMVKALPIRDLDLEAVDFAGMTALHRAVTLHSLETVEYLVQNGAGKNERYGKSLLHHLIQMEVCFRYRPNIFRQHGLGHLNEWMKPTPCPQMARFLLDSGVVPLVRTVLENSADQLRDEISKFPSGRDRYHDLWLIILRILEQAGKGLCWCGVCTYDVGDMAGCRRQQILESQHTVLEGDCLGPAIF